MFEDLLARLKAQEAKRRRYHDIVGKQPKKPLTLAGEAAVAIEALLDKQTETPKKRRRKRNGITPSLIFLVSRHEWGFAGAWGDSGWRSANAEKKKPAQLPGPVEVHGSS